MVSRTKKRIVLCQKADSGVGIWTFSMLQSASRGKGVYWYGLVKARRAASPQSRMQNQSKWNFNC
jgi:hypothetical protein